MKTVEDVVASMKRMTDEFEVLPASDDDLVELELACGNPLPLEYRRFLLSAGRTQELSAWTGGSSWFPEVVETQTRLRSSLLRRGLGEFALAIRFAWYEGQSFLMLGESSEWAIYFDGAGKVAQRAGQDDLVEVLASLYT